MNNIKSYPPIHAVSETSLLLYGTRNFCLRDIFDCGQCFRFYPLNEEKTAYGGVALGRRLKIEQTQNGLLFHTTEREFRSLWYDYFDMALDYEDCKRSFPCDAHLQKAAEAASGIRILHQPHWETLCSFILSQNNNIPRIRSLIESLCRTYGEPFCHEGNIYHAFPTAEAIAHATESELRALKVGFRASYLADAARKTASGTVDLTAIESLPTEKACAELCKINGVGPKIASCVLLFSYRKYDCFPIDVWVKRILEKYYPKGTDGTYFGKYAGIAQQYLFHYERNLSEQNE